jgi:hypothetical protein
VAILNRGVGVYGEKDCMKELMRLFLKITVFAVLPLIAIIFLGAGLIKIFISNIILQLVLSIIFAIILAFAFILYAYWLVDTKRIL